jgi:hypothetical protein
MVLSVDYSTNTILGFTAVVGLTVCTALYIRSRNATAHSITPCLNEQRFSTMTSNSTIDKVNYYFNPTKVPLVLGHPFKPLKTHDELVNVLAAAGKQHQACETIVIYGDKLEIYEDPRILELNPRKLILVGQGVSCNYINVNVHYSTSQKCVLRNEFQCRTWVWKVGIINAKSVEEAIHADPSDLTKNTGPYCKSKPQLTIYCVNQSA